MNDNSQYATKKEVREQADGSGCGYFMLVILLFILFSENCGLREKVNHLTERVDKLEREHLPERVHKLER